MLSVKIGSLGAPFTVYYSGSYTIRPGWGLQLTIIFSPRQAVPVSQNLVITSSDPGHPKVSVQIAGNGSKASSGR
jgi:hypothetical protein